MKCEFYFPLRLFLLLFAAINIQRAVLEMLSQTHVEIHANYPILLPGFDYNYTLTTELSKITQKPDFSGSRVIACGQTYLYSHGEHISIIISRKHATDLPKI
jgi:hypothetical protein